MNAVQQQNDRRSQRSSTAARHQDLQARLLAAAEAAIEMGGLAGLRARALSDTVGCSVGAIYGVFADLDALALAVNGRTLVAIDAAMRSAGAGKDPADHLMRLATAYLDYASANRNRWRALFEHRMTEGRDVPAWYAELRAASFANIELPLATLQPHLKASQIMVQARTVFSAVHGMVDLGLDEKLGDMKLPLLRAQIRLIVGAIAAGLT